MEAEDPLSQLRDIHLPDPVSFWPPAPGWWLLLLVILIAIVFACRHAIAAMIRRRKLASVLTELETAYGLYQRQRQDNGHSLHFLATVNSLLNRVTQVLYPDSGSANLTGRQWLRFLDACDNSTLFTEGPGKVLADGMYRPTFDGDADALYDCARQWITRRYQEKQPVQVSGDAHGSVAA